MEQTRLQNTAFPTAYAEIMQRIGQVDPIKYGNTRNYINGAVTYLSPYISRGVITTKQVLSEVLDRGYQPKQIQKFIQELAWRDYWQQVWIAKGDAINTDLKHVQNPVSNTAIPKAIVAATTGIDAIDTAIQRLYDTGYMHNHVRMYVAAIVCNMAQSHWKVPAQWMYYHLLDADWASNALSWQWVAGANANKKYVANQDNINTYCFTQQKGTFVDIPYSAFAALDIPEVLQSTPPLVLQTPLPDCTRLCIDTRLPTCIYNFYNLDPLWKGTDAANRVLLLEPSHFEQYPVSQKTLDFVIRIAKDNIEGIQIYVGAFDQLLKAYEIDHNTVYYKEHPLNCHYQGTEEPRDWMFDVQGYYPSFFAFWKRCKKQLVM